MLRLSLVLSCIFWLNTLQAQIYDFTWQSQELMLAEETLLNFPPSTKVFELLEKAKKQGFFKHAPSVYLTSLGFGPKGEMLGKQDFLEAIAPKLAWYADVELKKPLNPSQAKLIWEQAKFLGLSASINLNYKVKDGKFTWEIGALGLILQGVNGDCFIGAWTQTQGSQNLEPLQNQTWAWRTASVLVLEEAQGKGLKDFQENLFKQVWNNKKQAFPSMKAHSFSLIGKDTTLFDQKIEPIEDWGIWANWLKGISAISDTMMLFDPETFMEYEEIILGPQPELEHLSRLNLYWALAYEPKTNKMLYYVDGLSLCLDQYENSGKKLFTNQPVLYLK